MKVFFEMIGNPGFIIKLNATNLNRNGTSLRLFINKLPKEYGPQVIENIQERWEWLFFNPQNEFELQQKLFYDDGDTFLLFCGSIYNDEKFKNNNLLKDRLLKLIQSKSEINIASFLNSISGYFCGIAGSIRDNYLFAFTDKYGVNKLFYLNSNEEKIFSTNLYLIKEYIGKTAKFSDFAMSSIIYCSHTFTKQTIIENVNQILPGHYLYSHFNSGSIGQKDYMNYPKRLQLGLYESVSLVAEAHKNFMKSIKPIVENKVTLLLSRGKDCRVILKHLVDSQLIPNILTFFRTNNELYPFISFVLENNKDSLIAEKMCLFNHLNFSKIKIQNMSFLENIADIFLLNNGSPAHWEIFKASEAASNYSDYLISGFSGDFLAGKNIHYYSFEKIKSREEFGYHTFHETSDVNSYERIYNLLKTHSDFELLPITDLLQAWIEQYKTINSEDPNVIGWQGTVRTRSIGRIVPTFHQARLYTIPVYPYLDTDIINAYLTIPSKYLKGEAAHLMQISEDRRFNQFQTTRFPVSAKNEKKYLSIINFLRKVDLLKSNLNKNNHYDNKTTLRYNTVLKNTLKEMDVFENKFVDGLLPEQNKLPKGYYPCIANLVNALRLKEIYFDRSLGNRHDLVYTEYAANNLSLQPTGSRN